MLYLEIKHEGMTGYFWAEKNPTAMFLIGFSK